MGVLKVRVADAWVPVGTQGSSGPAGPAGPPGITAPFRLGHTWGLVGDVSAFTQLPAMHVPLRAGQGATLVGLRAEIGFGTSIGVQVRRNGSNVGSVITVTPITATTVFNQPLLDGDALTLVLSAPVGTPSHLGATIIIEHTPSG